MQLKWAAGLGFGQVACAHGAEGQILLFWNMLFLRSFVFCLANGFYSALYILFFIFLFFVGTVQCKCF